MPSSALLSVTFLLALTGDYFVNCIDGAPYQDVIKDVSLVASTTRRGFSITCQVSPTTSKFHLGIFWFENENSIEKFFQSSGQTKPTTATGDVPLSNETDHRFSEFVEADIEVLKVFSVAIDNDSFLVLAEAHWVGRARLENITKISNTSPTSTSEVGGGLSGLGKWAFTVVVNGTRQEDLGYYLCTNNKMVYHPRTIYKYSADMLFRSGNADKVSEREATCTQLNQVRFPSVRFWNSAGVRILEGERGNNSQIECCFFGPSEHLDLGQYCPHSEINVSMSLKNRWDSTSWNAAIARALSVKYSQDEEVSISETELTESHVRTASAHSMHWLKGASSQWMLEDHLADAACFI